MTPAVPAPLPLATGARLRAALRHALGISLLVASVGLALPGPVGAADRELSWASLTGPQQQALSPLKSYWATIDVNGRQKWLEVAARFPAMPTDERARAQQHMASWAALTPSERARARIQFQELRRLSPEERQARWEAYRALSEEERQRFVQAAPSAGKRPGPNGGAAATPKADRSGTKSNVVTATVTPRPRPVAPTVVQARPGASTTSIAAPPSPPPHHQTGLPKIVATPTFVDPATLLPRRGPQGAAVRSASRPADPPPE
jgi:hypothetical protein